MSIGILTGIHRYPVKSMGGEDLQSAELAEQGLAGDRAWAVRDEVRGGIRGAKKLPALMTCQARYEKAPPLGGSGPAEITLPDGTTISTSDSDAAERISGAIGGEVTLWPLLPADAVDHYLRGAPTHDDMEQELRAIFAREPGEALPNLGLFPPEILQYESPPGTYFDAFPLMLMSEQSLARMQALAPASNFDVRRFRPNLLVDALSDDPFPELNWRGKTLKIGAATLEITIECPRCVMVTHPQPGLPKDPKIMRALVAKAEGNLGVYARVQTPGQINKGDSLELDH
jgi:uncharacterized protein YcbX